MSITITIDTKEIERPNIEYDYIKQDEHYMIVVDFLRTNS